MKQRFAVWPTLTSKRPTGTNANQIRANLPICEEPSVFAKVAPKAINATIIGLYYLAFFAANTMVGWVGGFHEKWPTTNFWLLHAAFAAGAGLCFVLFKFVVSRRIEAEAL